MLPGTGSRTDGARPVASTPVPHQVSPAAVDMSVVIPTLGRPSLTDQLAALAACEWDGTWEVVVADNGAAQDAAARCAAAPVAPPGLRVVDASGRRGRSHAVNEGARAARGRWLLLCDDDDLVDPDIVAAVGGAFAAGARAVAFNFDVRTVNAPHVWQAVDHHELEEERPTFRGVPAVWGCCGIERTLFLDLGGFDEDLLYAEDLDLTLRLHRDHDVAVEWIPRRLVHYRLRDGFRARVRQRADYVVALDGLARRHPDVVDPVPGRPATHLVRTVLSAVRGVPDLFVPGRRLRRARVIGEGWGRFEATRRRDRAA